RPEDAEEAESAERRWREREGAEVAEGGPPRPPLLRVSEAGGSGGAEPPAPRSLPQVALPPPSLLYSSSPMELEIVKFPDPILRRVAKPLAAVDDAVRERARLMIDLMYRDKGVGLAAPQVGWGARLFVMNPTGKPEDARVFVNPEITMRSKAAERSNEG